jgi:hypothetical protein
MFHNNIKFMQWKKSIIIILALCLFVSHAGLAGEQIVLSPQAGHSNQEQINEAIKQAASSAKGASVFLTEGVYQVDNTIIMKSNVRLLGDSNAIIRVWGGSSQWFKGKTGVISCKEAIHDVEIAGFQIDGNIKELPKSYADSRSDTSHDCEKLIILWGNSNDYAYNIKIHDMKLYNAFSDGIYIIYARNVEVYNNFISNCQHEGIYFSVVKNGHIHNNKIAGITSDCARLDNSDTCLVEYNLFFSYGGESYGAYKHGENGLQIGDAGSSKGYNAAKKGYPTRNIEVRFNTFADPGLRAIWLHGGKNVYIHDNEFVDAAILETKGIPIGDISIDNQPTVEMSESVFSSILDLFKVDVYTQVGENDTVILPEGMKESNEKAVGTIEYQTVGNTTTTLIKIPEKALHGVTEVQYEVAGKKATHTLLIGERTSQGIVFQEADIWTGDLEHSRDVLKLPGRVGAEDIKVTCLTPKDSFHPVFEITEYEFIPFKINPGIFVIIGIVLFGVIEIGFILRHRA